jgi:predicted RNA-binding Zn-ribbon protein involved in translation (DUF1610 family)
MTLFGRIRHIPSSDRDASNSDPATGVTADRSGAAVRSHITSFWQDPLVVRWRLILEVALVAFGALTLSFLFIWATVTDRVGVEAIVVMIVVLMLSVFTVSYGRSCQARTLSLQQSAQESVAKTILATEVMMEFLREFTLKNQETITQVAESHKVRVIEELRRTVGALGLSNTDAHLRRELAQLDEMIERKIMDIPTGVAFPLPRLEVFDQTLRHIREPERTLTCPACGAMATRIRHIDSRKGIQYTCLQCAHEFSLGITVMLEKTS